MVQAKHPLQLTEIGLPSPCRTSDLRGSTYCSQLKSNGQSHAGDSLVHVHQMARGFACAYFASAIDSHRPLSRRRFLNSAHWRAEVRFGSVGLAILASQGLVRMDNNRCRDHSDDRKHNGKSGEYLLHRCISELLEHSYGRRRLTLMEIKFRSISPLFCPRP